MKGDVYIARSSDKEIVQRAECGEKKYRICVKDTNVQQGSRRVRSLTLLQLRY